MQEVQKFLRIVLSESNYQLQDLDTIKDDLGTLKLGFAVLQNSNSELSADSHRHRYKLKEISDTLDDQQDDIGMLKSQVGTLTSLTEKLLGKVHPCGGTGWMKVVDIDMAKPEQQCPSGWQETGYSKRTCGRVMTGGNTCNPATLTDSLPSYSHVCGRIVAYQFGGPDSFTGYTQDMSRTLTDNYVDGVALYYSTPPQHIWTFAAGTTELRTSNQRARQFCPCDRDSTDTIDIPSFVGNDYFCESQNVNYPNSGSERLRLYAEDVLWDGKDCLTSSNCCEFNRPPYFIKDLGGTTSANIVASICLNNRATISNIAVETVEIYIHE